MMRSRAAGDEGSAVLEFIIVGVLILVPIAYVVLSVMRVQAAVLASTQAVREAGRMFAVADSLGLAQARARTAARIAMADQGFAVPEGALRITCRGGGCLEPATSIDVSMDWVVDLPWVPEQLQGVATIPIHAVHTVPVDTYRVTS